MTAVEWLEEQLNKIFISNEIQQTNHLFEKALEMEKQQIVEAYNDGQAIPPFDYAEKYYDRTYKSTKK
jgi:hypothetical protein